LAVFIFDYRGMGIAKDRYRSEVSIWMQRPPTERDANMPRI
jgi:hypothetical protein